MEVTFKSLFDGEGGTITVTSEYGTGSDVLLNNSDLEDYWITIFDPTGEPTLDVNIYMDEEDKILKAALYYEGVVHETPLEVCNVIIQK